MRLAISSLAVTDGGGATTRGVGYAGGGIVGGNGGRVVGCVGLIVGGVASGILAPQYMQYFMAGASLPQLGQRTRGSLRSDN